MSSLFAFLHHLAAFAFVAMLVVEFMLLRDALTVVTARKILRADLVAGAAAGVVLGVGLLRVFYFEKGAAYYAHSATFIAKMALFAIVAALSVYPTLTFLSWRKALAAGQVPVADERRMRTVRTLVHLEMMGIVLIILCAALMARGVGHIG